MTEAELDWLTCPDTVRTLQHIRGVASDRKLRLLACGCCRLIWHLPDQPLPSHRAVEVAELYADGLAGEQDRADAEQQAWNAWYPDEATERETMGFTATAAFANTTGRTFNHTHPASGETVTRETWQYVQSCIEDVLWIGGREEEEGRFETDRDREFRYRIRSIVDCVFGNPFRPATFAPEWHTDTAVSLARQIYESREFGAMPILADALQDAGCDSDDILTHCRDASQVHVRGCWVVDLVLAKA